MQRGVLLFAHGARDARWAEPFQAVAARVRAADASLQGRLAFLELKTPTLLEAGRDLALAGCDRVEIVPLFLGAGGHVRKDLPELQRDLEAAYPLVQWRVRQAIGELEPVIDAMAAAAAKMAME